MASEDATSRDSLSAKKYAWIRGTGITLLLTVLALTLASDVAAQIECGSSWTSVGKEVTTLDLRDGDRVNRNGKNFTTYSIPDLFQGQQLRVDVSSNDFSPQLMVFRKTADGNLREVSAVGNPARIRFPVVVAGDYVAVISTERRGTYGRFTWNHAVCEPEKPSDPWPLGDWTYTTTGFSDIHTFKAGGLMQGDPPGKWVFDGKTVTITWPNGWTNVYVSVARGASEMGGLTYPPNSREGQESTLTRFEP